MDPYVEKMTDAVESRMQSASDAEGVAATVYYGDQAIALVLLGILSQLTDILKELQKR